VIIDRGSAADTRVRAHALVAALLVAAPWMATGCGDASRAVDVTSDTDADLDAAVADTDAVGESVAALVQTLGATSLGTTSLSVNGRVQPRGAPGHWWFEHGETTAYGRSTPRRQLGPRLLAHYREGWDTGLGGWRGGSGEDLVFHPEEGGFVRYTEPTGTDYNHSDGIGWLHLVQYFYPGHFDLDHPSAALGGASPDLTDAVVSVRLRGVRWDGRTRWPDPAVPVPFDRGDELVWWSQVDATAAEDQSRMSNWAHTGAFLTDALYSGQWSTRSYRLRADTRDWTYAGQDRSQGRDVYVYHPLGEVLSDLDVDLFHLLLFVDSAFLLGSGYDPSTGRVSAPCAIDFDAIDITYRNRSLLLPSNGGALVSSPADARGDAAALTDGHRHGAGHTWVSGPSPTEPLVFEYTLAVPVTVERVQIHNDPEHPSREVEVSVSADGATWSTIASGELPRVGVHGPSFAYRLWSGLAAEARRVRVTVRGGYRPDAWGLGEIEVFGTGAVFETDDDWYSVTEDLPGDLVAGRTYHYRLVVETSAGRFTGEDVTYTVPTGAPEVTSADATAIGERRVRLAGVVNTLGREGSYRFQLGPDTRYGFETKPWRTGPEITPRTFSRIIDFAHPDLAALPGGSVVHWRIVYCEACDTAAEVVIAGDDRTLTVPHAEPPRIDTIDPALGDPLGGVRVTIVGAHLAGATITVGGAPCDEVEALGDATLGCRTPALPAGRHDVRATTGVGDAVLAGGFEAWSPAELAGARLFDARVGVETGAAKTLYEWQRTSAEIAPDWRVRDGNTLTWLPSTGRFWMVGGWNGYQEPDGFSRVDPDLGVYPLQNTTNEVWSSPDGVAWRLELPHEHAQFERRHVHNTVLWNDALWVVGGDSHQGRYNHDVIRSADGVTWTAVLAPGEPPWEPRALQVAGVYDGKLWMAGGQDLLGDPATYVFHNDVWSTEDGVHWTEVAADAPASDTRWAGCGLVDGLVAFRGAMWLVGCAQYRENEVGTTMANEVWSTMDGLTWTRHATPPWAGKSWPNVVVWDDKLWILFGYTYGDPANGWPAGNANEVWFSEDGERWEALPIDYPAPGSHAQGVAVRDDRLLYAGGNYTFGFGAGVDRSAWQLVPFRGAAVTRWTDRGGDALSVAPPEPEARPVLVTDAFGAGEPGLQLDGSRSVLALEGGIDEQPAGRAVLWVARAPYLPLPWGWEETYAPIGTVLGGLDASGYPNSSIGLSGGALVMVNREPGVGPVGEPLWARVEAGSGLQDGPGAARLVGMSHATDGTVTAWVDGVEVATSGGAAYASPRSWSRIGGSMEGPYYGPSSRFAGTLGAVLVLPRALDAPTMRRVHAWARGRFGVP